MPTDDNTTNSGYDSDTTMKTGTVAMSFDDLLVDSGFDSDTTKKQ